LVFILIDDKYYKYNKTNKKDLLIYNKGIQIIY
jgi:hypothetical protein